MLQSLLQTDDWLCRRYFDHESHLHLYLHLHAAERHGCRYVNIDGQRQQYRQLRLFRLSRRCINGLRRLPPLWLWLVQQWRRYFHFEIQFWLRMQPLLRLSRYAAGRSTIRWGGPLFSALYK